MLIFILLVSILAQIFAFAAVLASGAGWLVAVFGAQGAGCVALLAAGVFAAAQRNQPNTGVTDQFRTTEI